MFVDAARRAHPGATAAGLASPVWARHLNTFGKLFERMARLNEKDYAFHSMLAAAAMKNKDASPWFLLMMQSAAEAALKPRPSFDRTAARCYSRPSSDCDNSTGRGHRRTRR